MPLLLGNEEILAFLVSGVQNAERNDSSTASETPPSLETPREPCF